MCSVSLVQIGILRVSLPSSPSKECGAVIVMIMLELSLPVAGVGRALVGDAEIGGNLIKVGWTKYLCAQGSKNSSKKMGTRRRKNN